MQPAYKLRRRARERAAFVAAIRARHEAATVSRDASVSADQGGVGTVDHGDANVRPACINAKPLEVGPAGGGFEGQKTAPRNAGVTASGAGA